MIWILKIHHSTGNDVKIQKDFPVASVAHQPSQVNVTIIHENDPFGFHD
jgi:hypothetical protein